jgi:AcrR family transcriptional regulator
MGRWEPDSRGRLQEAAFALFAERGYDQTTAAQIAERAGVTERTFFRHFADKREVLFGGSAQLKDLIVTAVRDAPESAGPLEAVAKGLDAAAGMLGEFRRDLSRQRLAVIASNPELRERELSKLSEYALAVAEELRQRGTGEAQARLAAEAGMGVFRVALESWATGSEDRALATVMRESVAGLRALVAGG